MWPLNLRWASSFSLPFPLSFCFRFESISSWCCNIVLKSPLLWFGSWFVHISVQASRTWFCTNFQSLTYVVCWYPFSSWFNQHVWSFLGWSGQKILFVLLLLLALSTFLMLHWSFLSTLRILYTTSRVFHHFFILTS